MSTDITAENNNLKNDAKGVSVEIQRLYVKSQSCKVPHGNQAFQQQGKPENHTELNITNQVVAQDVFEINLHITVDCKVDNRTVYQTEVQQAAVIKTNCKDEKRLSHLLNIHIPSILYPYARKVIADAIGNTGFPVLFLPIMDFASMYNKRAKEGGAEKLAEVVVDADAVH